MNGSIALRGPIIAGVSYAGLALLLSGLSRLGHVAPLVWVPGGIAVVGLLVTSLRRWPLMLAGLGLGHLTSTVLIGFSPLVATAYTVAHLLEAVICAAVGAYLFSRKAELQNPYASLGSLIVVALIGGSVSALIALPFREQPDLFDFAHWLLSHALGILSVTPIMLFLFDRRRPPASGRRLATMVSRAGLSHAIVGLFPLSLAVLIWLPGQFLLLLGFAIVISVIRYGQLAASAGVLTYAAAAMIAQGSGAYPASISGISPQGAALILQASMLLILVTSLPLAALLQTSDQLQARLKQQNAELGESLQVLTMAEELAGIGRWRLHLQTGQQHWSAAMLEMNGLDPALGPNPGDVTGLLPDGGAALFTALADHREDREPYQIDYTIYPAGGDEQFLRMVVSNEYDERGKRVAVFGVAMNITIQVCRERALQAARQHALDLAAHAQKLALTDQLTGLGNRRAVFEELGRLARSSPQQGEPLTVVMFDIDHFKHVNDTYGHQTGDAVLQRIAELTRRQVREGDLVGRIGGEEFVWLLPKVSIGQARDLAERLRALIERESAAGGLPSVTVSLGLALLRMGDTPEQLIARADEALYRAKESGRNCVQRAA